MGNGPEGVDQQNKNPVSPDSGDLEVVDDKNTPGQLAQEADDGYENQLEQRRQKFLSAIEQPEKKALLTQLKERTDNLAVSTTDQPNKLKESLFDLHVNARTKNPEQYQQQILPYLTTYPNPFNDQEELTIVPTPQDGTVQVHRVSETTWHTDSPQHELNSDGSLPDKLPFTIDDVSYELDCSADTPEIVWTGAGDMEEVEAEEKESIKEALENGNYTAAIKKVIDKVLSWFSGDPEKEKSVNEYYNLGPLLNELREGKLTQTEIQQRISSMEIQIAATNNRQTAIRLTRCLGLLKDHLDENEGEDSLTRLTEEADVGDCLLINQNDEQVTDATGWIGGKLLQMHEPGYGFTHIAIISSKSPLEITHSTANGFVTERVADYRSKHSFEAMLLQPNCPGETKNKIGAHAKQVAEEFEANPEITYDNKAAAADAVRLNSFMGMFGGGSKYNCGEFVAKVLTDVSSSFSAVENEPIPNDFLSNGKEVFTPTYSATIS